MSFPLPSFLRNAELAKFSGIRCITPFYHIISDEEPDHIWPLYDVVSTSDFRKHLDELSTDFEFISASQLKKLTEGEALNLKKFPAFLSFDDGLRECYDIVYPILKEKGLPATFFINPNFADGEDIFYRYKIALIISHLQDGHLTGAFAEEIQEVLREKGKLKYTLEEELLNLDYSDLELINRLFRYLNISISNADIYMNKIQIKTMAENGFEIGGHGLDHALFDLLDFEVQVKQIEQSVDFCVLNFGQKQRLFAFPFYDYNLPRRLFETMYGQLKIDLSFGTSGLKKDVFRQSIQRLDMEKDFGSAGGYIRNNMLSYFFKKMAGRHIMHRNS